MRAARLVLADRHDCPERTLSAVARHSYDVGKAAGRQLAEAEWADERKDLAESAASAYELGYAAGQEAVHTAETLDEDGGQLADAAAVYLAGYGQYTAPEMGTGDAAGTFRAWLAGRADAQETDR